MHIEPFRAVYPKLEYITSTDSFFDSIKEDYAEYKNSGFYNKSLQKALFIHQIQGPDQTHTGIVACADIDEYLRGNIKKHEHTLAHKEQKQLELLLRHRAAVKPILLTYPDVPAINSWTKAFIETHTPFIDIYFEEEQQSQLFWLIDDPGSLKELQQLFHEQIPVAYIADGHHRTSSAALLYQRSTDAALKAKYNRLFCAFFPSTDLKIHDFNRVIDGLNQLSPSRFMAEIAQLLDIDILQKPVRPRRKHEILMFIHNEWYMLHWKPHVLEAYHHEPVILDSLLLNERILRDILGISDVRSDQRIDYIAGPEGLEAIWERAVYKASHVGFCLYPVLLEEMTQLADQHRMLPPKSTTWFEPRIKNGLLVYEI